MKIKIVETRSIITKSKLPDTDYVINPYVGCQFGCQYCYASFMGRFANESIANWGNYVHVKSNAIELFKKELIVLIRKNPMAKLLLSSVTDPYHQPESKYKLTQGILSILVEYNYPGHISILTKSPSVLRDLDLIKQLNNVEVGFTITTTDDAIAMLLEKNAPPTPRRLITLKQLKDHGINTYAFIGPLLPHFRYQPEKLDLLFKEIAETGVDSIFVEHINLSSYIKTRLINELRDQPKEYLELYNNASTDGHRKALDSLVNTLIKKYQLKLRLNQVIAHDML